MLSVPCHGYASDTIIHPSPPHRMRTYDDVNNVYILMCNMITFTRNYKKTCKKFVSLIKMCSFATSESFRLSANAGNTVS